MKITLRLWRFARPFRVEFILAVLCGFAGGLLTIGQAAGLSRVVADVFLGGRTLSAEMGFFRLLILIILFRSFLVWANEVSASRFETRLKADIRRKLFDTLLRAGPAYTRGERSGELANTLFEGVEALGKYFSQTLPQVLLAALIPLSILILIFPKDPLSGAILFLTAPLIPVFLYLIGKGAEVLTRRQWDSLSRLSAYFMDSLQGLTTLKIFGQSRERAKLIAANNDQFRDITLKVLRVTFLSALVLELVATVSTAMVAVEVSLRLLYGRMAFQEAFFLLLLAPEFYLPLRQLGTRFHAGMAGLAAAQRILEIMDVRQDSLQKEDSPVQRIPNFTSLQMTRLCYTYPREQQPILENFNLEIKRGEHVALVGLSGAGKSTLAALLLGFIQPTAGEIGFDGLPLGELTLEAWRQNFAWIPQNPYLFHETIAANLRIARPEASQAELEQAAGAACLEPFIHSLPAGFETIVGEEGARLSGGEAQKVALARAFLKDAPILILDEPTSHLDPENEASLNASIERLMQDRTVITITHHPGLLGRVDRVIRLENGRVADESIQPDWLALNGASIRSTAAGGGFFPAKDLETDFQEVPGSLVPFSFSGSALTRYSAPAIFLRLLSFLRGSWGWVGLSVLLGGLTIASSAGLMGTAAYLLSTAALQPAFGALQIAIVAVRFFGITRGVFRYAERLVSHDVTFRLLGRLRSWFFQALEPLAPARLMQYRAGDLLARILADVETLENFYVRAVAPALVALLITTGMGLFLGLFDGRLAGVYLGFMAVLGLGLPILSWLSSRRFGEALVDQRAAFQARLVDGIQGVAEITAFNHGREYAGKLAKAENAYAHEQELNASSNGFFNALTIFGTQAGVLAVLGLSIPLVTSGRLTGPTMAALMLAAQAGFEAVLPLAPAAATFSACAQAAKRLFDVVEAVPAVVDRSSPIHLDTRKPTLECSALGFTYPESAQAALEGIEFRLEPGMRIAIVGPSGSGKSTLGSLFLRLWEYSRGHILLDDKELSEIAQESVRRQFSVVTQKPVFFDESILQNLLLGNPSASKTQVLEAVRKARLDEFIAGCPAGLDTRLGESGVRLSGGESRRLALARAYLKDAPIYLLDEPTAALDIQTESDVLESLLNAPRDRSLLLITHRLVGLEKMDEIIVLDKGRIVERGSHSSLLAQAGLYRRMWTLQQERVNMKT